MYADDITQITLAPPATLAQLAAFNTTHNLSASSAETKTETKPGQNRDETGTPAQPLQNQTTPLKRNRDESETKPKRP